MIPDSLIIAGGIVAGFVLGWGARFVKFKLDASEQRHERRANDVSRLIRNRQLTDHRGGMSMFH